MKPDSFPRFLQTHGVPEYCFRCPQEAGRLRELEELRARVAQLDRENSALRDRYVQLARANDRLRLKDAKQSLAIDKHRHKGAKHANEIKRLRDEKKQLVQEFQAKEAVYCQTITDLQSEKDQLAQDNLKLLEQISQLKLDKERLDAYADKLENEKRSLQEKLRTQQDDAAEEARKRALWAKTNVPPAKESLPDKVKRMAANKGKRSRKKASKNSLRDLQRSQTPAHPKGGQKNRKGKGMPLPTDARKDTV